eukprot:8783540-Karenia_brevis.AAC.1
MAIGTPRGGDPPGAEVRAIRKGFEEKRLKHSCLGEAICSEGHFEVNTTTCIYTGPGAARYGISRSILWGSSDGWAQGASAP